MNPAVFSSLPTSACTLGTASTLYGQDRIVRNVYDAADQLLQVQEGYGTSVQATEVTWTYSQNGKRQTLTDAEGNRTTLEYDGHDRLLKMRFPSPTTDGVSSTTDYEQYGYDPNGNRTTLRKRDGSTLTSTFDNLNRVTLKVVPERVGLDPSHTRDVHYSYDLRGLMTTARFDSVSGDGVTNAYDGLGRLLTSTINMNGMSRTLTHRYDSGSNRDRLTWPDNEITTFTYDGENRMIGVYEGAGTSVVMATIGYDGIGRRTSLGRRYGNTTTYGYDDAGRLGTLTQTFAGGPGNTTSTFSRNPASQIVSLARSNDLYAFTANANQNVSSTPNGLNQVASHGGTSFTHDANGNLTSNGSTTFTYDRENRLVGASGAVNATLHYDPMGRLWQLASGGNTTRFVHDGDRLAAEYNGSGTMLRRYIHGPNVDEVLIHHEGATLALPRFLHADERGSIVGYTDTTGVLVGTPNSYDEYGNVQSTLTGRFGYTGQAWLPEIGMHYYKARLYYPSLGRFMQTDPVGYEDQFNLYAYVENDPINATDPDGQQTVQDMQMQMRHENWRQMGYSEEEILQLEGSSALLELTTLSLLTPGPEDLLIAGLARYVSVSWTIARIQSAIANGGRLVLYAGRVPANLRRGDVTLNMRWGWTLRGNDRVISAVIRQRRPIADSHVFSNGRLRPAARGSVLERERTQIQRAGYRYNQEAREWQPGRQMCTGSRIPRETC